MTVQTPATAHAPEQSGFNRFLARQTPPTPGAAIDPTPEPQILVSSTDSRVRMIPIPAVAR